MLRSWGGLGVRIALLLVLALLAPLAAATTVRVPPPEPEPSAAAAREPSALATAAFGAASAMVGAAGALGLRAFARRWGPLLALYSRIARRDAARHPMRARILAAVEARPGRSVTDLALEVGVPVGSLLHHLRVLEDHEHVKTLRAGRHRLVFPTGKAADREALAALAVDRRREIARLLLERPGMHEAALAAALCVERSTVHHHVRAMEAAGLVRVERGVRARCYATARAQDAL